MTDKELLELAAKAAGYKCNREIAEQRAISGLIGLWIPEVSTNWNPLEDDGDALRLAVKLNMHIHADFDCGISSGVDVMYFEGHEYECECEIIAEQINDDPYSATRRAIVRAAAEIGKIK